MDGKSFKQPYFVYLTNFESERSLLEMESKDYQHKYYNLLGYYLRHALLAQFRTDLSQFRLSLTQRHNCKKTSSFQLDYRVFKYFSYN